VRRARNGGSARPSARAAHLPEQPFDHCLSATEVGGQEAARLFGEIEQDGAGLEHRDRFAALSRLSAIIRARLTTSNHLERAGLDALDNCCGDGGSRFAREA
jgi:hypothetical protein